MEWFEWEPASGDINVTKDKPQETNQVTEPEPSKCPECGSERVRSLYGKREWICLNVCEPPKLGECSRCEGTGFRYSTIAEGYTDEPCRHCGGTGIEPAPDNPDDELEQILKHVAYSPLPDGQTTYPEMIAEAHAKIMKLFKSWKCQK